MIKLTRVRANCRFFANWETRFAPQISIAFRETAGVLSMNIFLPRSDNVAFRPRKFYFRREDGQFVFQSVQVRFAGGVMRFGVFRRSSYVRSIVPVATLYSRSFRFEWKSNQGSLSVANNEFDEITTPFCTVRPVGRSVPLNVAQGRCHTG